MTKRIFRSICCVSLAVFLASLILIMGVLYEYFSQVQQQQLRTQTALAAQGMADEGADYLDGLDTRELRITWIAADGTVLFDSQSDAADMDNHIERQEITDALKNGYGESARYSTTLMERLLYSAQRLPDGTVIRLSVAQNSVITITLGILQPICIVIAIALILSLLLSSRVAKKIVQPLNALNLDDPLSNEGYDELSPLLRRIDSQQRQLKSQAQELQRRQDEFDAVTGSMNEGLVLLSSRGIILSINRAAARHLGADSHCEGKDILTVNRTLALQQLLEEAQGGRRAEKVVDLAGGRFQLDASPILSDGTVSGIALLMFDVADRERAEQMRREFTANVSHELKTPLHTISGCAELLKNGMVKPEDTNRFAGQIYTEAQRMIRLVEDIIRLSRLDEGAGDFTKEDTDLYALAAQSVQSLQPEAAAAGVHLTLSGSPAVVRGVPQLLSGIIYNLCDNAIKYNRPDGRADVCVSQDGGAVVLTVSDTGIGIPPEHQARIFERFYRVDKSRSKAVGGTGLGLSIVKHAAMIHNARIDLESKVGQGTVISVRFCK